MSPFTVASVREVWHLSLGHDLESGNPLKWHYSSAAAATAGHWASLLHHHHHMALPFGEREQGKRVAAFDGIKIVLM